MTALALAAAQPDEQPDEQHDEHDGGVVVAVLGTVAEAEPDALAVYLGAASPSLRPTLAALLGGAEVWTGLSPVAAPTPCWLPLGSVNSSGYVHAPAALARLGLHYAHRAALALTLGLDEGHEVHHACGVRRCARPGHLVGMTREQHTEAHLGPHPGEGLCRQGHPVVGPDAEVDRDGSCSRCHRERVAALRDCRRSCRCPECVVALGYVTRDEGAA